MLGLAASVSPGRKRYDHRAQRHAEIGQHVFVSRWIALIATTFHDTVLLQRLETGRQDAGRDAEVLLELIEASVAIEEIVQQEERSPVADIGERGRERAFQVFGTQLICHCGHTFE